MIPQKRKTTKEAVSPSFLQNKKGLFLAPALREVWHQQGYHRADFIADLIAGLTVGVIAVPLAMALAIASGVPPQQGLYTAIIAGSIIALFGGSRLGIAGPTAAFVVLLQPIAADYGLEGLLVATIIAGLFQILLGVSRLGYLIQFIPYPVTTGFTAGIATVIAVLQLKDFFGLDIASMPDTFIRKIQTLFSHMHHWQGPELTIASITLILLFLWKKTPFKVPGHLPALLTATIVALVWKHYQPEIQISTLGTRFHYEHLGQIFPGIPPFFPTPSWPSISWDILPDLIKPAFGLAILGAIESLLCAVVADGFAGTKHFPNTELIAQGLGNIVAPFFGGITATNAIARTTVNVRAGAKSPLAGVIHALTVLLCMVIFARYLSWVPMSALAGVLVFVAYQMADLKHFKRIMLTAPRSDRLVLWTCFLLTVFFDMVIAVGIGMILAAFLFMQRMVEIAGAKLIEDTAEIEMPPTLAKDIKIYQISGPLFFGAAEKAIENLRMYDKKAKVLVLVMKDVSTIDMTGFVALESLLQDMISDDTKVILCGLPTRLKARLLKLGFKGSEHVQFSPNLHDAVQQAEHQLNAQQVDHHPKRNRKSTDTPVDGL